MWKTLSVFSFITLFLVNLPAQYQKATINDDFYLEVTSVVAPDDIGFRENNFEQLSGFPKTHLANPTFKNVRNITLVDLNNDQIDDVLFAGDDQLFAYSATDLLWQKDLGGTTNYPPSVADIDKDGEVEIVQAVFGGLEDGRLVVLEKDGSDVMGFPIDFNNLIVTGATLADIDNNGLMEIVVNEITGSVGKVHIFKNDGTYFNEAWPVTLAARPAVTPSIADVDNDGEKEIVVFSTEGRYVLQQNGEPEVHWPLITDPLVRFSFHSPVLVPFTNDGTYQIVGSSTGDTPEYFALNHDASSAEGWPQTVPDATWTFSPPTVVTIDNEYNIFMSRPIGAEEREMLYAWDTSGNMLEGFPITKAGGLEGVISVADIDNDGAFELIFGSNLLGTDGFGFIHAYEMDGSGEVDGFPIRPRGWTYLNGVNLGDIDGDGLMDLSALTYTQNFGAATDSIYLNSYNLNIPYSADKILWSTYKGSNTRDGLVPALLPSTIEDIGVVEELSLSITPNPISDLPQIAVKLLEKQYVTIDVFSMTGLHLQNVFTGTLNSGEQHLFFDAQLFSEGIYMLVIRSENGSSSLQKFIK